MMFGIKGTVKVSWTKHKKNVSVVTLVAMGLGHCQVLLTGYCLLLQDCLVTVANIKHVSV